jgi:hypothetical protein
MEHLAPYEFPESQEAQALATTLSTAKSEDLLDAPTPGGSIDIIVIIVIIVVTIIIIIIVVIVVIVIIIIIIIIVIIYIVVVVVVVVVVTTIIASTITIVFTALTPIPVPPQQRICCKN